MTSKGLAMPSTLPQVEDIVAAIRKRSPRADPLRHLPDVHPARIPRHVAMIMDGNGRWALARGLPRALGHRAGAETVRRIVRACGELGIEQLTLYSFSAENWKRPDDEVAALMELCKAYLDAERESLVREGIRFRVIGRRHGLPDDVVAAIESVESATASGRAGTLCLAINYGGRAEIVDAARSLAKDAVAGSIDADAIDESAFASRLYTADMPDPDLLIRTAGEMRVSNYLLWQISYAELHVTDVLWPDFSVADFHEAIRDYAARSRRFGGLNPGS